MMKALTLHQPWATGMVLKVKRVETRSWPTSFRGDVAIHAAKTGAGIRSLPGDCEGNYEDGWWYGYIGCREEGDRAEWQASISTGVRPIAELDANHPAGGYNVPLPLGAVVAVATLVDCLPTEQVTVGAAYEHEPGQRLVIPRWEHLWGDYSPGRFAWVFEEVRSLDEPIPARGFQRLWNLEHPALEALAS